MTWTTRPRSEGAGALSYWCEGSGPSLVLIHGVGLRAEAWGAVMPLLTTNFTVYAVDMPGHGASALGQTKTLEDYVVRAREFVDWLEGSVYLVGHSMGAAIALKLAARGHDKVAGVAALNAIHRRSTEAGMAVQARAAAIRQAGSGDNAATLARWLGAAPVGSLKDAADACDRWLGNVDPEGYARAYTAFAVQDGPEIAELAALPEGALFMTGAQDGNSTPAMSRRMASVAPEATTQIVEDAAHMMPMTHPQAVAAALTGSFRRQTGQRL